MLIFFRFYISIHESSDKKLQTGQRIAVFGGHRWRKRKGTASIRFPNGEIHKAEVHWYEAHGIGRRKMKVKRILD